VLIADDRYLAIGALLGDGHRPGDPFGEHFADVTGEGLLKRVDSVDGLVCLPWHKDCDRGGHSMFCSGLTIGICLTPVDEAHGGLDVMAGSHRANIARTQIDDALGLPAVTLRAERGDVTVHMSCTLHRSTHPRSRERRVAYTGFALPARPGDSHEQDAEGRLRNERAAIGGSNGAQMAASRTKN
jgi:ectoine hydroxylase-related dioxygenase (phytanoyl-CoA dioxygenase family)